MNCRQGTIVETRHSVLSGPTVASPVSLRVARVIRGMGMGMGMGIGMLCFVTVQRDRQRPLRSRSTLSSPAGLRSLSTPSALRVGDSPLSQRACRKRAQAPLRAQSPRCSKRLSGEALTAVAQRISEVSWQRMTKCGFVTLARCYRVAVPNRGIVGNDKEKPKELRRHRGGDEDAHCSQSSSTSPSRMRLLLPSGAASGCGASLGQSDGKVQLKGPPYRTRTGGMKED